MARVSEQEVVPLPEGDVVRVPLQLEPASCSIGTAMFKAYREQAEWADIIHIHYPWPFADLVHLLSGVSKPVVLIIFLACLAVFGMICPYSSVSDWARLYYWSPL